MASLDFLLSPTEILSLAKLLCISYNLLSQDFHEQLSIFLEVFKSQVSTVLEIETFLTLLNSFSSFTRNDASRFTGAIYHKVLTLRQTSFQFCITIS